MYQTILTFAFLGLYFGHVCKSQSFEDAEAALMDLRQEVTKDLNAVNPVLGQMSASIDTAAVETKATAKKAIQQMSLGRSAPHCLAVFNLAASELDACVNDQADQGITLIENFGIFLLNTGLETIYSEQSNVVHCAFADSDCFANEIDRLQDLTPSLAHDIDVLVGAIQAEVNGVIADIKACANLDELERVAGKIQMCLT